MKIIQIAQVISALLLIAVILMQNRGTGLSGVFGGASGVFRTKRGIEKTLFTSTIVIAIVFVALSLFSLVYKG